jgi:N-acetylmuramoyl-L-alanine amidase CwlA
MSLVEKLSALKIEDFTNSTGIPVAQQLIPKGHPNRPNQTLSDFLAVIIHYTANEAPTAHSLATAKYFGRTYLGTAEAPLEANGKSFGYGSTQMIFDMKAGAQALPFSNVAWAVGDKNLPYTDEFKGQQKIHKYLFNNSGNYKSLSIEVCNNDVIKNSDEDWEAAVANAQKFVIWLVKGLGVKVNPLYSMYPEQYDASKFNRGTEILILRHFDMTGKKCPLPFIGEINTPPLEKWHTFIRDVVKQTT